MTTQVKINVDSKLKKQIESVVRELGSNLNAITEAFFKHVVSTNRIDFPLEDSFENSENTPADMTGEKLKKEMIKTGYDKTYATEHKEAYNDMLKAKKEGKLTRW